MSLIHKLLSKTKSLLPQINDFELILVDPQPILCEAWRHEFAKYAEVTVVDGYFEQLSEYDCMVSAANSFAFCQNYG
ncbi:MAG: hypothetical protein RLZZ628_3227 [Bacteroidota bacterium]|jgi:hypothetical protein